METSSRKFTLIGYQVDLGVAPSEDKRLQTIPTVVSRVHIVLVFQVEWVFVYSEVPAFLSQRLSDLLIEHDSKCKGMEVLARFLHSIHLFLISFILVEVHIHKPVLLNEFLEVVNWIYDREVGISDSFAPGNDRLILEFTTVRDLDSLVPDEQIIVTSLGPAHSECTVRTVDCSDFVLIKISSLCIFEDARQHFVLAGLRIV